EFDPDIGLINLRARLYNLGTGRFLTLDPLPGRPPVATNRYLYAAADPANRRDPLGLMAVEYTSTMPPAAALAGGATITVGAVAGSGAVGAGTALFVSTVAGVAGIAVSCALIRGSGLSQNEVLAAGLMSGSPFVAALAVCASKMICEEKLDETGPMGSCAFRCPNGTKAYCPCTFTSCEREE